MQASRPHKDDGVLDVITLEAVERLQILRQDAQGARILALQETRILIGLGLATGWFAGLVQSVPRFYPVVVLDDQIGAELSNGRRPPALTRDPYVVRSNPRARALQRVVSTLVRIEILAIGPNRRPKRGQGNSEIRCEAGSAI